MKELKQVLLAGSIDEVKEEVWDKLMTGIDANCDGEISFEEFKTILQQFIPKKTS